MGQVLKDELVGYKFGFQPNPEKCNALMQDWGNNTEEYFNLAIRANAAIEHALDCF